MYGPGKLHKLSAVTIMRERTTEDAFYSRNGLIYYSATALVVG
jgi:hypothetical protein